MINIQIVDDHQMVAESLSKTINESNIARVTGIYCDLNSCRKGLATETPDILLLDVKFPNDNGIDFCAEVKRDYPKLKIIMLTGHEEFNIVKHALHNGALGYIVKNADSKEIIAGIETVSNGKQFLCKKISQLLEEKKDEKVIWLTDQEKKILKYITDGFTTKEIANLILRDEETVKTYRRKLFVKLGPKNMAELAKMRYEMNLI